MMCSSAVFRRVGNIPRDKVSVGNPADEREKALAALTWGSKFLSQMK